MGEPDLIGKADLTDLQEFVKEYPYSSVFRMLYLVGLHNCQDVKYANELKSAAFYVSERQLLFQLLNKKKESVNAAQPSEAVVEEKVIASEPTVTKVNESVRHSQVFDIEAYLADKPDLPKASTGDEKKADLPMKNQSIIDKFLEASDKNDIHVKMDKKAENLSIVPREEESKQEPEECFTETLARIYIKQHKFDKAIKIFRRLSLKYPEKSVYFADQIRFFEKLIQNYKR